MSTKETFESDWSKRFAGSVTRSAPPVLSCWDPNGALVSRDALRQELGRCRRRMEELRQSLVEQEFIEAFCVAKLKVTDEKRPAHWNGSGPRLTGKRSLDEADRLRAEETGLRQVTKSSSLDGRIKNTRTDGVGNGHADPPQIEAEYASPIDTVTVNDDPALEDPYSEPVNPLVSRIPSLDSPKAVRSKVNFTLSSPCTARKVAMTNSQPVDKDMCLTESNDDDGSGDESLANLIAIRQSVSRLSQWCVDGGSARRKLEQSAQRLSSRFSTYNGGTTGASPWTNDLDTLQEALSPAPVTPSVPMDLLGGSVGMGVEPIWGGTVSQLNNDIGSASSEQPDNGGRSNGPVAPPSHSLDMRRWIVSTLLESERTYILTLTSLLELRGTLWGLIGTATAELEAVFSSLQKLFDAHKQFVVDLAVKVRDWSQDQSVGEEIKILAIHEYAIAPEYLKNYQKAIAVIAHCRQENGVFDEELKAHQVSGDTSPLEEMLHKPVIRFERNTLVLHDLIKYTSTGHVDYDLLQKTLKLARRFLDNLVTPEVDRDNLENQRYLVKHGLIVEKIGKERKLRHVFLFNDVIVAAKQKVAVRPKDQYEVKWFIPLTDLSLEDKYSNSDDMRMVEDHKQEVESMQKKVCELQAEYKMELKRSKDEKPKLLRRNKTLERVRKKLMEQEVALVIAMPHLQFIVHNRKFNKRYQLMMSSDYERSDWREAIAGLLNKAFLVQQVSTTLSMNEVQSLLGKQKMPNFKGSGSGFDRDSLIMDEDRLYGILHVIVNKVQGLKHATKTFCHIEVDSFGHFLTKAKTNILPAQKEPTWNERFEVDLDGASMLRVLCYSQDKGIDTLIGKGAIELNSLLPKDDFQQHTIMLSSDVSLTVSLKYLSHAQTIQRCSMSVSGVLFGATLATITKREGRSIPLLVVSCIQEIECRGMTEEGLYRISGLAMAVDELKEEFEKNPSAAVHKLKSVDTNVLTSIVKLFFRSLLDPLFTRDLYTSFAEGIGLADPDAKDNCLLALIRSLPPSNFATSVYLLDHLVRVSKLEAQNKMSLQNLATVFGPTLLHPAARNSQPRTMEQMFFLAAHEVTVQTTVLYHLLIMKTNGIEFDVSPPSVTEF